jgi:hypothetical protein
MRQPTSRGARRQKTTVTNRITGLTKPARSVGAPVRVGCVSRPTSSRPLAEQGVLTHG